MDGLAGCFLGALGLLIMFLSGECTLFVLSHGAKITGWSDVLILAAFGGLPILLGIGLFIGGFVMSDPKRRNRKPPSAG